MVVLQKHIAQKLNMSISTVSRCLRHDPRMPEETKVRVLQMASEAGYRSRRRETRVVDITGGVLGNSKELLKIGALVQSDETCATENAFKTLGGIGKAAQRIHASLMLHYVPFNQRGLIHLPEYQPEQMRNNSINGIVLINTFEQSSVEALASTIPCISIDIQYPNATVDCVGEENISSMRKVIAHLVELGHRRIGYIDTMALANSVSHDRLGGAIASMAQYGLDIDPRYVYWAGEINDKAKPPGLDFLHRWIKEGITALVCLNDHVAQEVYRWLKGNHYSCPQQVSITGFDAAFLPPEIPPITSVMVQFQDLGRLAVERLVARLQEPALPPVRLLLDSKLIVGKTTGPAKAP